VEITFSLIPNLTSLELASASDPKIISKLGKYAVRLWVKQLGKGREAITNDENMSKKCACEPSVSMRPQKRLQMELMWAWKGKIQA